MTPDAVSMRRALERIAKWIGEFPDTEQKWPDGSPMSYGDAYGSNGERDYMRRLAREALAAKPALVVGGDGMLPDALVPHTKEWYRLCERRFAVDNISISGELAEAIVNAIAELAARPGEVG